MEHQCCIEILYGRQRQRHWDLGYTYPGIPGYYPGMPGYGYGTLGEDPARFMDYLVRHLPGDLVENERARLSDSWFAEDNAEVKELLRELREEIEDTARIKK